MSDIRMVDLDYAESEEQFLRRIGGAVVHHWAKLPKPIQDLLVEQAPLMIDRENGSGLQFQIQQFIQKHQGGAA